jgi:transaldolase
MGPQTVNTMPPNTLDALRDHGTIASTVRDGVDEAKAQVAGLAKLGISLEAVADELEADGVKKFVASFDDLLKTIDQRRKELTARVDRV